MIAVLSGELDIASAPALREELLGLLRPAASRLIIDLSAVGYADASGVAVLVGTGRRAGLLGGWLRLASPTPEVARVLSVMGVNWHFATFPTVESAITGGRPDNGMTDMRAGIPRRRARIPPSYAAAVPVLYAVNDNELRAAVTALLANAGAWRDADPRRRFVPALGVLARAHLGSSSGALTQAAQSLLAVLGREPLTHSPEVAATASRLRRVLYPDDRDNRSAAS